MRVALLICDHVKAEFVEEHGDYPLMFRRLLPTVDMDDWFVCDGQFPNINDYGAFICTGSKSSVYQEVEWIIDLKALIRNIYEAKKRFVGICFGHQMMAQALGGQVKKSKNGYLIGVREFKIKEDLNRVTDLASSFNVLMLCQDQVCSLPPEAKLWASSPLCNVGMFTVGSYFLGIQGHPEYTKAFNQALFQTRPELIDQDMVNDGIATFHKSPDNKYLSLLIGRFLSEQPKQSFFR